MNENHHERAIDPDLFESLLTAINTISAVGSFAIAWWQIRKDTKSNRGELDRFQIKQQISSAEEHFDAAFRSMRELIALYKSVELRENNILSNIKPVFGRATYKFTTSEFQYYQNLMVKLNGSFSQVVNTTNGLTLILSVVKISGEGSITNNLDDIHEKLNDLLYNSENFDDALRKLEVLRSEARSFLAQLVNLGNGPA